MLYFFIIILINLVTAMVQAHLGKLSEAKLGFEIKHSSDINRALNTIKRGEVPDIDEQIGILKLVLEYSKSQSIEWRKPNFYLFLDMLDSISSKVGRNQDYKIDIQRISQSFEELMKETPFQNTKKSVRERIAQLVASQGNYATAATAAQRGTRAFRIRN